MVSSTNLSFKEKIRGQTEFASYLPDLSVRNSRIEGSFDPYDLSEVMNVKSVDTF